MESRPENINTPNQPEYDYKPEMSVLDVSKYEDLKKSLDIFKLVGIDNEYHGYDRPTDNYTTGVNGSD